MHVRWVLWWCRQWIFTDCGKLSSFFQWPSFRSTKIFFPTIFINSEVKFVHYHLLRDTWSVQKVPRKPKRFFNSLYNEKLPLRPESPTSIYFVLTSSDSPHCIMCAFELWGSNVKNEMEWRSVIRFLIPFHLLLFFFIVTEEATMEETGPVLAFQVCCPG